MWGCITCLQSMLYSVVPNLCDGVEPITCVMLLLARMVRLPTSKQRCCKVSYIPFLTCLDAWLDVTWRKGLDLLSLDLTWRERLDFTVSWRMTSCRVAITEHTLCIVFADGLGLYYTHDKSTIRCLNQTKIMTFVSFWSNIINVCSKWNQGVLN